MEKIIYKDEEKEIEMKLDLEKKRVWITQNEIAKIFNLDRSVISKYLIEELKHCTSLEQVCAKFAQVAQNGKEYKMKHYSLEVILEIGYKIDVNKTLEFKEWVNNLIKEYEKLENVKSPMPVEIFEDNNFKLEVSISPKENTVWLSQEQMSKLFNVARNTISEHISNILNDEELDEGSVGFSDIPTLNKSIKIYNLDMIISVGYRVKSKRGILFRKWATKILSNYLMKGYAIDENRVVLYKENYLELNNAFLKIQEKVETHDRRLTKLEENKKEEINNKIFFKGELYDSYSFIVKLIKKAKYKLTLIDNYVDNITLDILSNKNTNVNLTIVTSSIISNISITNFNKQYPNLTVKYNNTFHDKFLVIDDTYLYLIGSSIKDAGKKCFAICEMNKDILNKVKIVI